MAKEKGIKKKGVPHNTTYGLNRLIFLALLEKGLLTV
jgi:hypothetical protein